MALYKPVSGSQDFSEFQQDVDLVYDFVSSVSLQLNIGKTKYSTIGAQVLNEFDFILY